MIIMACNEICFSFGTDLILDKVTCNLKLGEKAGLVGVNGAGKSTLFKIIYGIIQQDSGELYLARGLKTGYLEQNSGLESGNTIWAEMLTAYSQLLSIETRLKTVEKNISIEKDEKYLHSMVKEYDSLLERYKREGGYEYNSRIKGVLRGLGFMENQFDLVVKNLSGGQKTRLALAKLLLEEPDLLLLDEPTNHLDISAIEWLEDFLRSYKKAVLIISHDRYFLDAVTTKTIELENCKCTTYDGCYSVYVKNKAVAREIQSRHYEQQQKEIARIEAFIEQQRRWNREKNIIAAESRQKALDRMKKVNAPEKLPDSIKIKFKSGIISGNDVLSVKNLAKSFGRKGELTFKELFKGISFDIKRNEKVFLLGPNGCGKSTLLKILAGKIPQSEGSIEYGQKIVLGYYDQELEDLNENNTILEEVWNENDELTHTQVRNVLAQFLFTGEDVFKKVGVLSGGEKSRVALAKLMLSGANFLLLDEPTNHLDVKSREVLEEALLAYDGTLLAVSHDRYFVQKLASRILTMYQNGLENYQGDYSYYLEHRRLPESQTAVNGQVLTAAKKEHIESKEVKAKRRKLEKQLAACESEISAIEARLTEIEAEMSHEDASSDHILLSELHNEQVELESRLEKLYSDWSSYEEQLESLLS